MTPENRPIRILMMNSARRWIGEAAHTLSLVEALRQRGHQVWLAVRADHELHQKALGRGIPLVPLAFSSRFSPIADARDCLRVRNILRREKIDLLHCHRGKDHWLAAAANLLMPRPTPLVRTRHVVTPARQHFLNRWLYRAATQGLISVSRAAHDSLGALSAFFPPEKQLLLYAAVDSELFSPSRRSDDVRKSYDVQADDVWIGLIGRLQRVKGQRYFVKAAALLARKYPQARFLIAGRGSAGHVEALWNYADSVGLPRENLRIEGILPDLPQVLASLDMGVVASVGSEGSSRVTLEYMASGLPFVATKVGGIPELVGNGKEGLLVEPRDASALADRMERLVADAHLRQSMGSDGRKAALERFDPGRWVGEVEGLYARILADKS